MSANCDRVRDDRVCSERRRQSA